MWSSEAGSFSFSIAKFISLSCKNRQAMRAGRESGSCRSRSPKTLRVKRKSRGLWPPNLSLLEGGVTQTFLSVLENEI
jgi:hypothetical protein